MNQRLILDVMTILRWRAKNSKDARSRAAYATAYNLLVYAMRGNDTKIKEFLEETKND